MEQFFCKLFQCAIKGVFSLEVAVAQLIVSLDGINSDDVNSYFTSSFIADWKIQKQKALLHLGLPYFQCVKRGLVL